eukprot:759814-Hanusia_phi.AAC.2
MEVRTREMREVTCETGLYLNKTSMNKKDRRRSRRRSRSRSRSNNNKNNTKLLTRRKQNKSNHHPCS